MNIVIDKNIAVPLYEQLRKQLAQAIYSGELKAGDKMPTEEDLCDKYNISRTVARQAYAELINNDLCVRNRGRGTFVKASSANDNLILSSYNFSNEIMAKGVELSTKEISLSLIDYDAIVFEKMKLEKNSKVWKLERIRYINGEPFVRMTNYIPQMYFYDLDKYNFNRVGLYEVFEKDYNQYVMKTKRIITTHKVDRKMAEELNCNIATAVFRIENIGYSESGSILDYCDEFINGEKHPLEFDVDRREK